MPFRTHTITIVKGDPSTRKLTLNPADAVSVDRWDTVEWIIASSGSNVGSFRIKGKDPTRDIFASSNPPPSRLTTRGSALVKLTAREGIYEYSIFWTPSFGGGELEDDPKIAVDPGSGLHDFNFLLKSENLKAAVIGMAAGILGFFASKFLSENKQEKNIFKK